jgi:hypothetical protein
VNGGCPSRKSSATTQPCVEVGVHGLIHYTGALSTCPSAHGRHFAPFPSECILLLMYKRTHVIPTAVCLLYLCIRRLAYRREYVHGMREVALPILVRLRDQHRSNGLAKGREASNHTHTQSHTLQQLANLEMEYN